MRRPPQLWPFCPRSSRIGLWPLPQPKKDYFSLSATNATVGGGGSNTASNYDATVSGGLYNTASGFAATVPGPAYEMDFPVVVYEISQENTSITFYRSAGWDEVEGMPSGELRGVMLFSVPGG